MIASLRLTCVLVLLRLLRREALTCHRGTCRIDQANSSYPPRRSITQLGEREELGDGCGSEARSPKTSQAASLAPRCEQARGASHAISCYCGPRRKPPTTTLTGVTRDALTPAVAPSPLSVDYRHRPSLLARIRPRRLWGLMRALWCLASEWSGRQLSTPEQKHAHMSPQLQRGWSRFSLPAGLVVGAVGHRWASRDEWVTR